MNYIYLGILCATILAGLWSYLFYYSIESKRRLERILHFDSYATVLEYHMNKAYDIIHKDRILIFSIEATKMSEMDFQRAAVDFTHLVLKMIGSVLQKEFTQFYGDEDTLLFNINEYFSTRYEDDEIRKKSMADLMSEGTGQGDEITEG